jgi:hypothetical protein
LYGLRDLNTLERKTAAPLLVLVITMMGLIRPIVIKRTKTVLHSRDAEGPPTKYGMASDDHDEYDLFLLREDRNERERLVE